MPTYYETPASAATTILAIVLPTYCSKPGELALASSSHEFQ